MSFEKWNQKERYAAQSDCVREALESEDHGLDRLLELMRGKEEAALYLAGTRLDHDFGFGSEDIGWLISVMPEDREKAAVPGYHPGSTEVYITFQGQLSLEVLEDGQVVEKRLRKDDALVLSPGQCHRVQPDPEQKAASLIVKTNLTHQPSVVRCADCGYYEDPAQCPLAQRCG